MFAKLWSLIEVIKLLLQLFKEFAELKEYQRKMEEEKKAQERKKAIEDAKKAETEDEIFDSQERIVGNKP